ncbi:MAG TPA: cobalamin B12-binding domain-containing protein [Egibacteraceae bacterium]|nr:cobalamin B12-binding domain-containing protein [Egibacteraceae bacterium]
MTELAAFLECATAGDVHGGVTMVNRLIEGGMTAEDVVLRVLAPAQRHVGRRWERNELTVAEEHLATTVADGALAAVVQATPPPSAAPTVLLVCAEQEWHGVAARMCAALLGGWGFAVRFLGASVPADDVAAYAADLRPAAVLVSCTFPAALPGAVRTIRAGHCAGAPVIAGGRGFGSAAVRGLALGAQAAVDVRELPVVLREWLARGAPELPPRGWRPAGEPAQLSLAVSKDDVLRSAMDDLPRRHPNLRAYDARQLLRTREDLAHILSFVEAAVLVEDPSLLGRMLRWTAGVLEARGVAADALPSGIAVLDGALTDHPEARACLQHAARLARVGASGD